MIAHSKQVLTHEPKRSLRGIPDAIKAQPGPHFPVAFASEGRTLDAGGYVVEQFVVAVKSDRPSTARRAISRNLACIMCGPGEAPGSTNQHQPIRLTSGGRGGPAHFLDLSNPKGSLASMIRIFSRRSSISMVCSPIFSLRRLYSASSAGERFFKTLSLTGQKCTSPLQERGRRHAEFPTERLDVFTKQEPENRLALILRPVSLGSRLRLPGSTRATDSLHRRDGRHIPIVLLAHESLDGESLYSQFGVQENPIPEKKK